VAWAEWISNPRTFFHSHETGEDRKILSRFSFSFTPNVNFD
jgi:hypothetical protein